jgi:hypothetical protein
MILHTEYEQHSAEWMIARSGIPTASEFDSLVTPDFKIRTGDMPKTYLAKKLAEAWQGGPLAGFNVFDMEQGQILEDEAKPWYELEFGEKIQSVGFVTTDDGRVGCSPDGLIGDDGGIEIKCPAAHTHIGYILKGELPKDYAAQVHGSMYVTGRPWWKFLSYRRHFPPLMLTIFRDEEIIEKIDEAVKEFLACFDSAMARLIEKNGGPPHRSSIPSTPKPSNPETEDNFDLIP